MSRRRLGTRRGVSLVEIVVALTILSTVLISLTGLMWQMGRQARLSGEGALRSAALERGLARAQYTPWDSLSALSGCRTDSVGMLAYTRCVDLWTPIPNFTRMTIVVTPTNALVLRPETLLVDRTRPRSPSPFYNP